MAAFLSDLRLAVRLLTKRPGFAAMAVIVLALGVGPTTAIFSIVYADLLAPLPYPNPGQLVMIWSTFKGGQSNQVSAADYLDWKRQTSSFSEMGAFFGQAFNLSSRQEPQYVDGQRVSTNWYKLLGQKIWLGRDFRPDDDQPGKDHVFLMSHRCWLRRFGGDPGIVGKQFYLNEEPYTAIGVLAPGPADRQEEIRAPLRFSAAELDRSATFWFVGARIKPGVSLQQAQQEMNAVSSRIAKQYPAIRAGWGASVEPLKNNFQSPTTIRNIWLLFAAVGMVLLIACANVANLLLVRGVGRQRELAVRASLGATGGRLIWQMLIESLMLAAIGGIAGMVLSVALLKTILVILPARTLSPEADVRLSWPVLLFSVAVTGLSGILFGCAPALQARVVDLRESLQKGGRSAIGAANAKLRRSLVVVEIALALALLTSAALTIHSFVNRTRVDLGVRTDHILTFTLPVPQSRLSKEEATDRFYRDLLARLRSIPGVRSAAASTNRPLDDPNLELPTTIRGNGISEETPDVSFEAITPGYFDTFSVRLQRGRWFGDRDAANGPRVALVNETFVRRFLKGKNPLSIRLEFALLQNGQLAFGRGGEWQIVGVFHDVQNSERVGTPKWPQVWVPFAQSPWPIATVSVRTAADPTRMLNAIAKTVRQLDRNLPLADVKTADELVRDRFVEDRFGIALYGGLAGVALLLASVGIYGVMSFAVAQSTSEIGLRMALGASERDILQRVLKQGLGMALTGLGLGALGAYAANRALQSSLYGTGDLDWSAFAAVATLLLAAALAACYFPAQRASRVAPIIALGQE
jgi:putative ABC transport system permease protein